MKNLNLKIVVRALCFLLQFEVFFLLLSSAVSLIYGEPEYFWLLISAGITAAVSLPGTYLTRETKIKMGKKEGYLVVSLVWVVFSIFGMLPYLFAGTATTVTDAFFETMSGFTATGASVLPHIENMSHGIMFWRCTTQWLGGMGIIVLSLAILPLLGIGGMSLFAAEVPGPTKDKIHSKISVTAKVLWGIYAAITLIESFCLWFAGMDYFDAICHSFTTMSSGGFSTKPESIAFWHSNSIEYIVSVFMLFSGINFTMYYYLFKGKFSKISKNEELHFYILFIVVMTLIVMGALLYDNNNVIDLESAFRHAFFNVTGIVTTTAFINYDFTLWAPFIWTILLILMVFGGCSGSTSGGIKTVRIALLLKNSYYEFKRLIHPNAVIPVRFNGQVVKPQLIDNVQAFIFLYMVIMVISMLIFTLFGMGFDEAASTAICMISNVGVGIGEFGPSCSYASVVPGCKWFMAFLMLAGRLELFTVLMVFTPSFWKK